MENLQIPRLYRITNNNFLPTINSIWISDNGNIVKITGTNKTKSLVYVCFKPLQDNNKFSDNESVISLQKFYSVFTSYEN